MDSIFLLTIGFIFLGALLSNVLKWSNKDRVLKDLQGFHSTIEMQSGKKVWGKTNIYSNGMELHFSRSASNALGNPINSFIFYGADIDKIRTIFRNHGELSEKNQLKRAKEVARVSNPDFLHRSSRKLRIFFNVFNDAIGEALNVFLSRMKGSGGVLSTQGDYIKKMGTTALSSSGNEYDPILESYINKRVSVNLEDEHGHSEYCGYLKEYSSAWMSVLNCSVTHAHKIDLDDLTRLSLQRDLDFHYTLYEVKPGEYALDVKIDAFGEEPMKLIGVKGGDDDKDVAENTRNYQHRLNKTLKQGESLSFTLNNLPTETLVDVDPTLLPLSIEMVSEVRREGELPEAYFTHQKLLPELKLEIESTHIADVYLPRTIAIVRHSAG
ncbi:hypothetical protein OO007_15525 [Cocleimonas sp. KMM 6892]|uniref:hypothetical protein n=1 Tax=unclassified Cocleimonas TaxID=2639732 RepID=UPI002DC04F10|nr:MULTISPECIES: hypothetical protein [unclassified Cocleimonas]MEB8433649.1 hypothetical protein [Cocleimonas sp. KMM 6892]MEC4716460.1 hypothetical protein [Cocleimonas sp. KMM 6895]MEC4745647.1 hypothetical protein [Cocleimonas sp. KMM 6896]